MTEIQDLNPKNLIQISMDGPNVNIALAKKATVYFYSCKTTCTNLNINTPCSSSFLATPSLNNFENKDNLNINEINTHCISNVSLPAPPVSNVSKEKKHYFYVKKFKAAY